VASSAGRVSPGRDSLGTGADFGAELLAHWQTPLDPDLALQQPQQVEVVWPQHEARRTPRAAQCGQRGEAAVFAALPEPHPHAATGSPASVTSTAASHTSARAVRLRESCTGTPHGNTKVQSYL